MTDEMMTLRGMVKKAPDADGLRNMIGLTKAAFDIFSACGPGFSPNWGAGPP